MASDFDPKATNPRFPPTRASAIRSLGSDDTAERARAFGLLVQAYWRPVYMHVRLKWRRNADEARDLTQGFFARALEKRAFVGYEPGRGRFRTYLRGSLDNYVVDLAREESRQKRGGDTLHLNVDFAVLEEELGSSSALSGAADATDIEACFDREWKRSLFAAAVQALERACSEQGKQTYFEVFRRYVLDPEMSGVGVSYADVAKACGIAVSDVTNYLSWTKRELRARVLDELRAITTSDEELRDEARAVLGIEL